MAQYYSDISDMEVTEKRRPKKIIFSSDSSSGDEQSGNCNASLPAIPKGTNVYFLFVFFKYFLL